MSEVPLYGIHSDVITRYPVNLFSKGSAGLARTMHVSEDWIGDGRLSMSSALDVGKG
jgi:hypothetical protein